MDLKTTKSQEIFGGIKKIGSVMFYLILFFSFFAIVGYYMMQVKIDEKSVPNYDKLTNKSYYKEYEKMMDGKNVEGLIADRRFEEMKYNQDVSDFIKGNVPTNPNEDIFN